MRSVILGVGMSLDGYIAREDGSVDFLFMPKDFSMAGFMASVDTALMGRKTFDEAIKLGGLSGGPIANHVFSRSLAPGKRNGVTYVRDAPMAFVEKLRQQRGRNLWLMGGGELAREFLKADLVDELFLGIVPLLLGDGIPLFGGRFPQRNFKLVENKTYSRGLISLRYKRARAKAEPKRKP